MNKLRKLFHRYNGSKTIVKYNGAQFAHNTTFDALIKKLVLIIEKLHLIIQRKMVR